MALKIINASEFLRWQERLRELGLLSLVRRKGILHMYVNT